MLRVHFLGCHFNWRLHDLSAGYWITLTGAVTAQKAPLWEGVRHDSQFILKAGFYCSRFLINLFFHEFKQNEAATSGREKRCRICQQMKQQQQLYPSPCWGTLTFMSGITILMVLQFHHWFKSHVILRILCFHRKIKLGSSLRIKPIRCSCFCDTGGRKA